ncbi:MAG: hypothetical protein WA020_14505, partial [Candidatus Acidiferrales bacterium]
MSTLTSKIPEPSTPSLLPLLDTVLKRQIQVLQEYSYLVGDTLAKIFTPPHSFSDVLQQMDLIGVG